MCVCVLASGYRWGTVMHEIPIFSFPISMTSLPYPRTQYIKASKWNELSPEAKTKIIEAEKKSKARDDDNKSIALVKSLSKTVKSLEKSNRKLKKSVSALQKCEEDDDTNSSLSTEGTSHFQKSVEML